MFSHDFCPVTFEHYRRRAEVTSIEFAFRIMETAIFALPQPKVLYKLQPCGGRDFNSWLGVMYEYCSVQLGSRNGGFIAKTH